MSDQLSYGRPAKGSRSGRGGVEVRGGGARENTKAPNDLAGKGLGEEGSFMNRSGVDVILEGIKVLGELQLTPWSAKGYFHLGEVYTDLGQER
jgi:hypothetical protein